MSNFPIDCFRNYSVFFAMLFTLFLAACSSGPESVVQGYFKAAAANKVEDALAYVSFKNVKETELTMVKGKMQMIIGGQYAKIQKKGGLDSISTTLIDKNDDIAHVEAEIKFKDKSTEKGKYTLIYDSGTWKIQF